MMEETLKSWIEESRRIVFFGGAGVSTESGIPDFRSRMGCTTNSTTSLRRRSSAMIFFSIGRRYFLNFTASGCSAHRQNQMPRTLLLQSWSERES